jgi:hypothetical protein
MVAKYYSYKTGQKTFIELGGMKGFTPTTDGISLKKEFQPVTKKKL